MLVAGIAIGLVIGAALLLGVMQLLGRSSLGEAAAKRDELINNAKRDSENLRREAEIEAREQAVKIRAEAERDAQDRRTQIGRLEERVLQLGVQDARHGGQPHRTGATVPARDSLPQYACTAR